MENQRLYQNTLTFIFKKVTSEVLLLFIVVFFCVVLLLFIKFQLVKFYYVSSIYNVSSSTACIELHHSMHTINSFRWAMSSPQLNYVGGFCLFMCFSRWWSSVKFWGFYAFYFYVSAICSFSLLFLCVWSCSYLSLFLCV